MGIERLGGAGEGGDGVGVCDFDAVSAGGFGFVEGLVRGGEEAVVGGVFGGGLGGAADADGDAAVGIGRVGEAALFECEADLLGDGLGNLAGGVGEYCDELFATVAGEEVAWTLDDGARGFGDLAEAGVALEMAVEVIVEFEVVYVHDEEREHGVIAGGTLPLEVDGFVEAAAVGDAGETVEAGKAFDETISLVEFVLGGFAGGDVADDVDEADGVAGDVVAVEAEVGFDPEVVAILFAAAVGEDVGGVADAAVGEQLLEGGDVVWMDDLFVVSAEQFLRLPAEDFGDGG